MSDFIIRTDEACFPFFLQVVKGLEDTGIDTGLTVNHEKKRSGIVIDYDSDKLLKDDIYRFSMIYIQAKEAFNYYEEACNSLGDDEPNLVIKSTAFLTKAFVLSEKTKLIQSLRMINLRLGFEKLEPLFEYFLNLVSFSFNDENLKKISFEIPTPVNELKMIQHAKTLNDYYLRKQTTVKDAPESKQQKKETKPKHLNDELRRIFDCAVDNSPKGITEHITMLSKDKSSGWRIDEITGNAVFSCACNASPKGKYSKTLTLSDKNMSKILLPFRK
jgi:hypothetical protein